MGEPIKAEKIGKHFVAAVSPGFAQTPFGKRAVPTLPVLDLSRAINAASKTYGNAAPLFLLTSLAPDATAQKLFIPHEALYTNPVEMSFATAHGHTGTILSKNAPPVPGAINCGVLAGPEASCSAEIEALVSALAERMAKEFKEAPFKFLMDFNSAADAAVANVLKSQAQGIGDWIVGAYDWAVDKTSRGIEYVLDGGAARDIASAADYVSSGEIVTDLANGAVSAYEWGKEAVDTLMNLDYAEVYEACKQWLLETLGTLTCDARDALAGMLADKRSMATQMGEMYGTAKVAVAEAAAAVAVDVLVTKGAASAATRVGGMIAKAGPRLGKLADKIGDLMRRARRKPDAGPSRTPKPEPKPTPKPHSEASPPKPKPKGDTVDGPDKPIPCLDCPIQGAPVNTIFGCKILGDDTELDFVIDAPLPLRWQRNYVSSNAHESFLGQGWTLPLDHRLEIEPDGFVLVEAQGRRIAFPRLAVGSERFSPHEQSTLRRTARNTCELVTPDGLRLIFGLAPSDHARATGLEALEQAQARQFEQALREASIAFDATAADDRAPQAPTLVLLGLIDQNDNWLRLHYAPDDRPYVIECSDGRHVGLHYDSARATLSPRLLRVDELLGEPDVDGRFAASRPLVEYRYDAAGDLVAVVDGNGVVVRTFAWSNHIMIEHAEPGGIVSRYEWDVVTPRGRVLTNTLSTGEVLRFEYDPAGKRNRVIDASGRTTTYCYDDSFYFTGLVAPDGSHTQYQRDGHGNLTAVIDPLGRRTRYSYDGVGRLIRIDRPDGSSHQWGYDGKNRRPTTFTDPLGQTTQQRYDARNNLIETRDPDGAVTRYELDARGLPVRIHDARGGTLELKHDRSGRLVEYRDCLGQPTRYAYDERGNPVAMTDALGSTTRYEYQRINRRDRIVAISLPDGAVERLAYDELGRLIAYVDANGQPTRYALSADGRPLARENALGHTLRYQYDVHGRLCALTNETGAVHCFAWDLADRLVSERGFDGRRIDYRYNAAGELVESADGVVDAQPWMALAQGSIRRSYFQRDLLGRLTDKISVKAGDTSQPEVRHSRYTYNLNGQLVQARNRYARVELHYTATGRLAREITRTRGGQVNTVEHAYDGLGNRYRSVLPDGRVLVHHLYGSGHVGRITLDEATVCEFERDALQRETVRHQGALQTFYERDALGRLLRQDVKAASGAPSAEPRIARHYRYDRSGQLLSIDDARNGRSLYQYDAAGRLLAAMSAAGNERFAFDPASNLIDDDAAGSTPATAEPKRRWTDAEWQAYVCENVRRDGFNPLLGPKHLAADPQQWDNAKTNRLSVYQQHRFRYDLWGNCIEKRSGAHEVRAFRWDAEHQLERAAITRVERGALVHETWGYDYDPFGRRVAKYPLPNVAIDGAAGSHAGAIQRARQGVGATHFAWDGNRLLLERTGGSQTLYLYEPGKFVPLALVRSDAPAAEPAEASPLPQEWRSLKDLYPEQWAAVEQRRQKMLRKLGVETEPPAQRAAAEILHVHADHLGTPRELTDNAGNVVWSARYKAWGGVASIDTPPRRTLLRDGNTLREIWEEPTAPVVQNLRFQGQYFDAETGLHYNRFRYYDPDVGRFAGQDPIGLLGGNNLYLYAPNPVQWIDPLGLSCWGDLLIKAGIPKPADMERPHGHHIVFKGDFDHLPDMKAALERSRAVVEQYGVDPVNDVGALMWAPNKGHSVDNAELVAKKLEEADKNLRAKGINPKSDCGKFAMFKELQRIGKEVFLP